jgi:hypothetical protein
VEEVLAVLHEVNLLDKKLSLLFAESFLLEQCRSGLLELIVGSLNLFDVELLLLVHLIEPFLHYLLLIASHGLDRVEKVPGPHDLRIHNHFVDKVIRLCNHESVCKARWSVYCAGSSSRFQRLRHLLGVEFCILAQIG